MGGGAAGKVDFPTYMKDFHDEFLNNSQPPNVDSGFALDDLLNAALQSNSPYFGEQSYNPDTALDTIQSRLTTWISNSDAVSPEADWISANSAARTAADDGTTFPKVDLSTTSHADAFTNVGNAVDKIVDVSTIVADGSSSFQNRTIARHQRNVAQFAAGMADINAVVGSAFVWGMALLKNDREQEVSEFEFRIEELTRVELAKIAASAQFSAAADRNRRRDEFVARANNEILAHTKFDLELQGKTADAQKRVSLAKIVAKAEQLARQVELDYLDATYDFTLFQYGGNFLASINGAPLIPKEPSKFQSILGGAAGGAAAGATLGAEGAVIGAVAGTLLSL